jgi:glycosyltransferase involved in cell wall biosynthesis
VSAAPKVVARAPAPSTRFKILLFIPNLQQGGAERQILELMTKLPSRFETTLCVYEDVVHYRDYLPPGEPRHVLGTPRMGRQGLARLVDVLERERPDIVHSYRDKANFWVRLAVSRLAARKGADASALPIVVTAVRSRAMSLRHLSTEWYLSRRSDRVIANSEGVRRELVSLARVRPEKIQVLHNFIDLDRFHPPTPAERAAARAHWGLRDGEVALLLPGRIGIQKHQMGLAVALRRLARAGRLGDNVRVLLAGRKRDRTYASLLPRMLEVLGLTKAVTFLGSVEEMVPLYHAADALLMPSLWEGLPNAVLEGHACGLPAVVSHAANIDRLVLDGESGFEVPTFDHPALAEALGRMIALEDAERRAMGARGRAHLAEQFGPDRVLSETVRLYDDLLSAKGRA